jgi:hypothetical protein
MPEEIKSEETQENPTEEPVEEEPQEEETPEETPTEETAPPKQEAERPKYTDREKRYYARMKLAEEEAKKAKEALSQTKAPIPEIDAILEVQSATKDLTPDEVAELKLRAAAEGISLTEARKAPNYLLWQTAYREKVEKEKAAKPSTLQPEVEKPKTFVDELKDTEKLSFADEITKKAEILEKQGLWKNYRRRTPEDRIRLSQNQ